ncbi:MAG: LytTR family DNA-binding domain-containing protein [bacterium]
MTPLSSGAISVLLAHLEGEIRLIPLRDVLYCYAEGGRTQLVTPQGELPSRSSLHELAERLESSRFFRAHRAYLVNLDHVRSIVPWTRNAYSLSLDGRREIPLSKHKIRALRDLLGW